MVDKGSSEGWVSTRVEAFEGRRRVSALYCKVLRHGERCFGGLQARTRLEAAGPV